jgi:hypothetical protein
MTANIGCNHLRMPRFLPWTLGLALLLAGMGPAKATANVLDDLVGCPGYVHLHTESVSSGSASLYGSNEGWCVRYDIMEPPNHCATTTNFVFHTILSSGTAYADGGGTQSSTQSGSNPQGPRSGILRGPWPDGTGSSVEWFAAWSKVDVCSTQTTTTNTKSYSWDCPSPFEDTPAALSPAAWVLIAVGVIVLCSKVTFASQKTSGTTTVYHQPLHNVNHGASLTIPLAPQITSLGWSGKQYGCDALDALEMILGPREIDNYRVDTTVEFTSAATLDVGVTPSVVHKLTSFSGFSRAMWSPEGIRAVYESSSPGTLQGLVTFDVDYEMGEQTAALLWAGAHAAGVDDALLLDSWKTHPCSSLVGISEPQLWTSAIVASNSIQSSSRSSNLDTTVHMDNEHWEADE